MTPLGDPKIQEEANALGFVGARVIVRGLFTMGRASGPNAAPLAMRAFEAPAIRVPDRRLLPICDARALALRMRTPSAIRCPLAKVVLLFGVAVVTAGACVLAANPRVEGAIGPFDLAGVSHVSCSRANRALFGTRVHFSMRIYMTAGVRRAASAAS